MSAGSLPWTFSINTSYNGSPVQSSGGSPPRASFGLWQAQGNYADAIRTLLRQGQYTGDELVELEGKLIYSYYLELNGASLSPIRSATLFSLAREAHRRLIAYSLYDTGAATDFAKALVALADWDLMFSMNARAIERYEQAYRLMVSAGASESTIREIFAPQTPVMLPSFAKNPLALRAVDETVGHIDVAFETSKYGKSRKIRVVDASSGTTKTAERDLVRLIASSRFRPRVTEDETIAAAPYRLRYYVSE